MNTRETKLPTLPTIGEDVLRLIAENLSATSVSALSSTCRNIRNTNMKDFISDKFRNEVIDAYHKYLIKTLIWYMYDLEWIDQRTNSVGGVHHWTGKDMDRIKKQVEDIFSNFSETFKEQYTWIFEPEINWLSQSSKRGEICMNSRILANNLLRNAGLNYRFRFIGSLNPDSMYKMSVVKLSTTAYVGDWLLDDDDLFDLDMDDGGASHGGGAWNLGMMESEGEEIGDESESDDGIDVIV